MVLRNRLFKIDRFRRCSSLFSRIAGFFRSCLPKTNIVVPVKEHDSDMVQGSSQSAVKEINNNIIDAFTVACSSGKNYEEFEGEQEVRSQTNFIRVRSNESTDEFDDEDFFADAELSFDSENSDISDLFSSVSLPILSSEHINDDSASDDDQAETTSESTFQCSSFEELEQDKEEDTEASSEQLVDANSSSEELVGKYPKQEILTTPQEEEIVVSDGDLSIDELINDLLEFPASKSDLLSNNSESSSELDLPGLESETSSGISCTFDSTANIEPVDDACVPDVKVASVLPTDHQGTEEDAAEGEVAETDAAKTDAEEAGPAETDALVADATITDVEKDHETTADADTAKRDVVEAEAARTDASVADTTITDVGEGHAATADVNEDTAANRDAAPESEVALKQDVCSRESLSKELPDFEAKDATTPTDGATGTTTDSAPHLSEQNEGCSYKDLSLDIEAAEGVATETTAASIPDLSVHPEQSSYEPSLSGCPNPEASVESGSNVNASGDTSSDPCIEEEGRGSLYSWSTDYFLNKASDDYADDSFESYIEEDQLPADEDRLKNRDDDNDILTPEEVREIIAAAKERLRQATDHVKSILKANSNSSNPQLAKKNVTFAEYHEGPAYRQKAKGDESNIDSCNNFNSKSETEETDSRSVAEMIAAAKQRLNFAADKVKDYVTGAGPRFQFRSTGNYAETANDVETVANKDVAVKSLENLQEEYTKPDSPIGVRKANSFTMFIPFGETSDLQRRNQHLFFQGKNHERVMLDFPDEQETDDYDPYTEIDDHANDIYDQLNFDTYADSDAFSMQHGQESSILQIQEQSFGQAHQ